MYIDAYSEKYQRSQGERIVILGTANKPERKAFLSLKMSTRSVYDLAMRENFIDGLITMDNIQDDLMPSNQFYLERDPATIFILQSVNLFEQQPNTRNINAVKKNCTVTIKRFDFKNEESTQKTWNPVYDNVSGFVYSLLKDSKNFGAGFEQNTVITVQIPKFDYYNNPHKIYATDKMVIKNEKTGQEEEIFCESIDELGITGVIRIQGTVDKRLEDGVS